MQTQHPYTFHLSDNELKVLDQFIKGTAIYIEELELKEHKAMPDFWQTRTRAMRVVNELLIQRIEQQQ